ncbi:MAG: hypothetical protein K2H20_01765, partial [Bacilli bacterium]|nr:hypothetical protein [Bacilli bacterium]
MKKYGISKYILFVLMSFLSFFGIASASRNLSSGEGFTISSASFPGVSCKTEGDNNPFKLTETSSGYRVTNPEGTLPGLEGKVTCTYDGNDGEKKPLNYDIVTTASSTGSFGLSKDNQEVDVLTIIGQGKIIDISSSSEYILIDRNNCNESGCPIRINPDAFDQADSGKKINAAVTVKYEINGNEYEYTLDVNVDKFNGARLYPGGVGVCSFSSNEWVYRTTSLSSGTNTFAYYEGIVGAKLPDCTPSNPVVEVEFKGWSSGLTNDSKPKAIGGCTNVVPAGTAVSSGNYSACYEQRPTVQLAVREGNIENISDWKYSDGRGYYYIGSSTTTTTLPDIAFVGYNEGSTLQGWESNGVTKQPGDTIDLDGSIWVAVIDTTTITERDYNKRVYVNQTVKFTVKDMSSCPSYSDSFLSFKEEGGSCWVTGISATPDGSPVDVPVQVGNKTLTFKYTVLSLSGSAQNGDEDFIIDTTTNVNYSSEISDLDMDGVITEVPETFYIKKTSEGVAVSDKLGSAYIYQAMWDENGVDTAHLALCIDPGRQGPGTDGKMYRRVDDPTGNDDFNKLFRYYIEELIPTVGIDEFGKVDSSWRVAAQVTVRIAAMQDGLSGSYSGSGILKTHFEGYQKGANKLKELETSGNFTDSAIKDVLKNTMGISNTGYIDAITKILTEYKQYDPASDGVGTDVSRKITERQSTVLGSDGYEINYKGTISLPTGATSVPTLNPNECNTNFGSTGVQCAVNGTLTRNDEESNAQGKEVYNYDVTIKVPNANNVVPPKTTDEKKKVSFKLEYSGGNNIKDTYLAEPANGAFLQRMIVFDYSNQAGNTYIYF